MHARTVLACLLAGLNLFVPVVPLMAAPPSGRVKSLRIEACLAQLDSDSEPDGLRIIVIPLDARGHLVPVSGRVDFTLVGELEPSERYQRMRRPPEFHELEHKSFQVHRADFGNGPAIYEITFTRFHPDRMPDLAWEALLKARLSVPGQGVFDASDAHVGMRDVSWFRDQLELYRG